jgi:hypothetical protein
MRAGKPAATSEQPDILVDYWLLSEFKRIASVSNN